MATKKDKVDDINAAIKKSTTATKLGAKAELLKAGTVQYSMLSTTRMGREYRIKVSFRKILSLLWGEDMRRLHKKYGR